LDIRIIEISRQSSRKRALLVLTAASGINKMLGYKELEILTPQSWLQEDDNG